MEQLELHLNVEQCGRWCAARLMNLTAFTRYKNTLDHTIGDRTIEGVAILLREQVRSGDLLAHDARQSQELHARSGGDEFCLLIPRLDDIGAAAAIVGRFHEAVLREDWVAVDPRLAARPIGWTPLPSAGTSAARWPRRCWPCGQVDGRS